VNQLTLHWRPFAFPLPQPLGTARGLVHEKRGWLLRLEDRQGRCGWGEAAALELEPRPAEPWNSQDTTTSQTTAIATAIAALGHQQERTNLEALIPRLPPPLGFALGAALAELEGLVGQGKGWRSAPASAWLLPAGAGALEALEQALARGACSPSSPPLPFTVKWKVAALPDPEERQLLEELLRRLPAGARLRLDANGGWSRPLAWAWTERLAEEPRLQWLEQPLPAEDLEGLEQLAGRLPVALDESLAAAPALRQQWSGWQVRRPALEGDPRPLLRLLEQGQQGQRMVSTAFETGIGRRWLEHLAALQVLGPTPVAPGLAPGWCPNGSLWARDPEQVWGAARCP
jgi:O-succinylbenzoate synthase